MPYILKTTESFTVCRYSTHFCFPLCFTSSTSWPPTTLRLWQEGAGAERGVTVSEHDSSGASLCPGGRTRWDGMTREAEVATWDYSLAHRDWRPRKKGRNFATMNGKQNTWETLQLTFLVSCVQKMFLQGFSPVLWCHASAPACEHRALQKRNGHHIWLKEESV